MFLLYKNIFSLSCRMRSKNFYDVIMGCFQLIAGQTWQNFTSKNRPQMSDLFRDITEGPLHI